MYEYKKYIVAQNKNNYIPLLTRISTEISDTQGHSVIRLTFNARVSCSQFNVSPTMTVISQREYSNYLFILFKKI